MTAVGAAAPPVRIVPRNQVLPVLVVIAGLAGVGAGFVTVAPNRLVSGTGWHSQAAHRRC
jgi:hypothetical protein